MMSHKRSVSYLGTTLLCLALLASSATATASSLVYKFGPGAIAGQEARFSIIGDFDAEGSAEEMVFFSIDVGPSHTDLTAGGTDYSAFSFTPQIVGWSLSYDFAQGGLNESFAEFHTFTNPLGTGDDYALGVLSVDFSTLGLTPGDSYAVSIDGPYSVFGVEEPGSFPSFNLVPTFTTPSRGFTVPIGGVVIPEPITLTCALLSVGFVGRYVRRRRLS